MTVLVDGISEWTIDVIGCELSIGSIYQEKKRIDCDDDDSYDDDDDDDHCKRSYRELWDILLGFQRREIAEIQDEIPGYLHRQL